MMNAVTPYLRVLAGFFAGVVTWLAIVSLVQLDFGSVAISLIMAAGLWYLAVGRPIRNHFARIKAEKDALAARAQAGHEAFLAGDTSAAFAPPPEAPARKPVRRGVVIASVVAAGFVLIGIISDISDGLDADSSTEDITETSAMLVPAPPPAAPAGQVPLAPQPSSAASAGSGTTQSLMPNVMCMNLQTAQDTIQEAGVYFSRSEDATGKGRMQISDRNWVVVEQRPAAGTPIAEGDAVLSVVKYGEPGDCS
ncbi:PASTA domain-containing protein [Rhodococcus sp. BE178]|uniref:PASTA domain-containing protein n=1 Tax=Rhodococcus sp. BE178 TaxID=2817737 RepID=UPI003D1BDB9E